jgi:hypothetical protein
LIEKVQRPALIANMEVCCKSAASFSG